MSRKPQSTWGSRVVSVSDAGRVVGSDHHTAKLSEEDIYLIFALKEAGLSVRRIAAKFDTHPRVSKSMVAYVISGKRRCQLAKGQRRVRINPRLTPAALEEFDAVHTDSPVMPDSAGHHVSGLGHTVPR